MEQGGGVDELDAGGELDVAVLLTSSVKDRLALNVETLVVSPYRLWLPLGHVLAQQELITLEELAGQPLIQLMVDEIEESTRRLTAALPVKPQIAFRTRSVEAVRSLVATGAGLHVAAYYIEEQSVLTATQTVLALAIPVGLYLALIFALYSYMVRTIDVFHIVLVSLVAITLAASVVLVSAGVDMAVCLLVVMLAPIVVVIGFELVGHRHAEEALRQAVVGEP